MNTHKKSEKYVLWGGRVLFFIYLIGLCYFLFFAENYGRIAGGNDYRYNLVPFYEITRFWKYREILGIYSFLNLVGNVLIFVPAGFFVPILWKKKKGMVFTTCITFEMSLLVEVLQLIFRVGIFDVDDLILNTLGGILGYILLELLKRWRHYEKT